MRVLRWPLFAIVMWSAGCGNGVPGTSLANVGSTTSPSLPAAATAADLAFCVSETNRYRTANIRPVLARSASLEAYATAGAKIDGQGTTPHQHFLSGADGALALAENEIHRQPLALFN